MSDLQLAIKINNLLFAGAIDEAKEMLLDIHENEYKMLLEALIASSDGNYEAQRDIVLQLMNNPNLDPIVQIWAVLELIWAYFRLGDYLIANGFADQALEIYLKHTELIDQKLPFIRGDIYNALGSLAIEQGKVDDAIEYYRLVLEIRKNESRNPLSLGSAQNNYAFALQKRGQLREALDLYHKALSLFHNIAPPTRIARIMSNIAEIHRFRSEFGLALSYHKKVLKIRQNAENLYDLALSNYYVGKTLMEMVQPRNAIPYFEKSDQLWDQIGNLQWSSANLLDWGKTLLQLNLPLTDVIESLELAKALDENPVINQRYALISALQLKIINRLSSIVEAQQFLQSIIDAPLIDFELYYDAVLHSCEILFTEIRLSHDDQIFKKIQDYIGTLEELTKSNGALGKMIEILIMKSKLAIVALEYDKALNLISQAELVAIENSLEFYLPIISIEKQKMGEQISQVKAVLEKNEELIERIQLVELTDYLNQAQRIKKEVDDTNTEN